MHESGKQRVNNLFYFRTGRNFFWIVLYVCKLDFFWRGNIAQVVYFLFQFPRPFIKSFACFCFCFRERNLDCNVFVHYIFMNNLPAPLLVNLQPVLRFLKMETSYIEFVLISPVPLDEIILYKLIKKVYHPPPRPLRTKDDDGKLENFPVNSSTIFLFFPLTIIWRPLL